MFKSTNKKTTVIKIAVASTFIAALTFSPLAAAQEHEHGSDTAASKEVTGEVVDMMCYVDHNAVGEKHGQSCGAKCIRSGGPAGIVSDGKAYLVVGEHKPMNDRERRDRKEIIVAVSLRETRALPTGRPLQALYL